MAQQRRSLLVTGLIWAAAVVPHAPAACDTPLTNRFTKMWDRVCGGTGHDTAVGLITAGQGGVLVSGHSSSAPTNLPNGKSEASRGGIDYWIIHVDVNGNKVWDRTYGGSGADQNPSIAAASDGGCIVAGDSNSGVSGDKSQSTQGGFDFWVLKLDANGNKVWDKDFGTSQADNTPSVAPTTNGGAFVAGTSSGGAEGNKSEASRGFNDYWILRLDASGNKLWDRTYGGPSNDNCAAAAATADGGVIVAGNSSSTNLGDKSQPSRGRADYWILRLDSDGNKVWDKTYGGTNDDQALAVAVTPDDGVLVAGQSSSGASGDKTEASRGLLDYWILKLDSSGNKVWDRTYGGSSNDNPTSIAVFPDGSCLVAGTSVSVLDGDRTQTSHGAHDYWILKLDPQGNLLWDKVIGAGLLTNTGFRSDMCSGIRITSDGKAVVSGSSHSPATGDKTEASIGNFDYWLVKLDADTDCDALPDFWEDAAGLSSTNDADAAGDADGDGASNYAEYLADTSPTNAASFLRFTALSTSAVTWAGGTWSTQYIERATSVQQAAWTILSTNLPPTAITNALPQPVTNSATYYRVRAAR